MAKHFSRDLIIGAGVLVVVLLTVVLIFPGDPGPVSSSNRALSGSVDKQPLSGDAHTWTGEEKRVLASLWLKKLPPLFPDPSNAVADDETAAGLGHKLFFDTRFSADGEVSCATCHQPDLMFTDGLPRAKGIGMTARNTMTIVGTAYSPWFFWDGRKDSQWSQVLGPTESPVEHGGNRGQYAHLIAGDEEYRRAYEMIFGPFPDLSDPESFPDSAGPVEDPEARAAWEQMSQEDRETINRIFANMGKAIAAYERLIMPGPGRFDDYVRAVMDDDLTGMRDTLTVSEAEGLHLFIGKAQCTQCHNGPLLTNNAFHNTGTPPAPDLPLDPGRSEGILQAKEDPFNCLGKYSDATPDDCGHLRFARTEGPELIGAFRTPTLRNVVETGPYMHAGQFATLTEVLEHYNQAPAAVSGKSELTPLNLAPAELQNLEAFLHTLSGPLAAPAELLAPP